MLSMKQYLYGSNAEMGDNIHSPLYLTKLQSFLVPLHISPRQCFLAEQYVQVIAFMGLNTCNKPTRDFQDEDSHLIRLTQTAEGSCLKVKGILSFL